MAEGDALRDREAGVAKIYARGQPLHAANLDLSTHWESGY